MHAADVFVFYDDVQYINRGWVNRNQISINETPAWLTLPVHKADRSLPINLRQYALEEAIVPIKRKLQVSYAKSSAFEEIYPFICGLLDFGDPNVAIFNANLLTATARKLGLKCKFMTSSEIEKPVDLHGEAKIVDICSRLGTSQYLNAIGGENLYNAANFEEHGIQLSFLETRIPPTTMASGATHLSIIHLLMTNGFKGTQRLLDEYEIIYPPDNRENRPDIPA